MSAAVIAFEQAQKAYQAKDYQTALILAGDSIKRDPSFYKPWVLRGAIHLIMKNYYPAVLNNDKALELEPDLCQALNNRAAGYMALNLLDETAADLNKSIGLNSESMEPHLLLGLMYSSTNQLEAAEFHLREASRLSKHHFVPHVALGTLLLGLDQWREGFVQEQHRTELTQPFEAPYWQGENLNGKKLLLFSESGQGDRINSFRYINLLRDKYPEAQIIVKVLPGLDRLLKQSFPDLEVTTSSMGSGFDYVFPLLTVPVTFDLTWKTVPRPEKYLKVSQELIELWGTRLAGLPHGPRVGVCWMSFNGSGKVLPNNVVEELGTTPNVNFVSLQVPFPHKRDNPKIKMTYYHDEITDWADTAALIENLDLVITVDTGVAHMAGALGKPVWVLVRYGTYWPWMAAHIPPSPRYSIWYPSMQLFRAQLMGDWMMPMSRVILELQRQLVR